MLSIRAKFFIWYVCFASCSAFASSSFPDSANIRAVAGAFNRVCLEDLLETSAAPQKDANPVEGVDYVNRPWQLKGQARRRFLFFRVYDVALYVPYLKDEVFNRDKPYLLQLLYHRDISKERVLQALRKGVRENTDPARQATVLKNFEKLLEPYINSVSDGDRLSFLHTSADLACLIMNREPLMVLRDRLLIEALSAIWLGEKSVVDREKLLDL